MAFRNAALTAILRQKSLHGFCSMTAPVPNAGFFIAPVLAPDSEWDGGDAHHHPTLILQRVDALLKETLDVFSMAFSDGSVRPERLAALVDCILRNFSKKPVEAPAQEAVTDLDPFSCPGCRDFLGEPVTVACGHSFCKRCLDQELFSKCKACGQKLSEEPKPNVILNGVLRKWFPEDMERYRCVREVEDLTRRKRFRGALTLVNKLLKSDPSDVVALACRAEVYEGLKQYPLALEDVAVVVLRSAGWTQGYFQKARILQEMGQVDDSLQVFLHCLLLDADFMPARRKVAEILCDRLSPSCCDMEASLHQATVSVLPYTRAKALVRTAHGEAAVEQHAEGTEQPALKRAQSMWAGSGGPGAPDGLKRVRSAPQLGDQDKGTQLKRKLLASDSGHTPIPQEGNMHQNKEGSVPHRAVPVHLVEASDFECSLCMRLFYRPVSTPCGHTFCRSCLERCLDHTPQCPLCKHSLKQVSPPPHPGSSCTQTHARVPPAMLHPPSPPPQYLASRKYPLTQLLDDVIQKYLPVEKLDRQKLHAEETQELSDLTRSVPVFVCTVAYPTVPCPLHVFEPRYRLMVRRCMETGTRQFAMCLNDAQKGYVDYGCMLHIRSVHFLPDGRSVVDAVGRSRFRVLSRSMRDGYCIADIKYLEDVKVQNGPELSELQVLHDQVYEQAQAWFQNLNNHFQRQILQHFGPMPEREPNIQATADGPACCWWLLAVLPVDPRYQLSMLSLLSLRERLLKIQHILTYLQSMPGD
uniref:LON peptidase N-terminal domain and ring finger 1 n=1 Tax=Paramormyrops kingsleyae TaxID=1676925 RepID=A0A3B3QVW4_9TELE